MLISNKSKSKIGYYKMDATADKEEYTVHLRRFFLLLLMVFITLFILAKPGQALAAEQSPTIYTLRAVSIDKTTAILQAIVNPDGLETTYYFEYGMNTKYKTSRRKKIMDAGSGTENIMVTLEAERLHSNTIYHYRIVAQNSAGTTYGKDMTFKTLIDYSDGTDMGGKGGGDDCSCG